MSRGIVKLPQDLGTVALRVVLTVAPDRNLLGLWDQRLRQLDNALPGGDSPTLMGSEEKARVWCKPDERVATGKAYR